MRGELKAWESDLAGALGAPLALACAREPLAERALAPGERVRFERVEPARARDWLLGRAALKAALRRLGAAEDTSTVSFPHPRLSLTHAGGLAFAAATTSPAAGLGIDWEPRAELRPGAARLFLSADERRLFGRLPEARRAEALLRLWCIKEALFKADPANAGRFVGEYRVGSLEPAGQGTAPGGRRLRYASLRARGGILAAAVQEE